LIVVDMQNDFVRVGAPLEVPDARLTIPNIRRLLDRFRGTGRPVVFTCFVAGPKETLVWTWSPELRPPVLCCRPGYRRFYADLGAERECTAVIDELEPLPGEYLVDKYGYGAFFRTSLEDILRAEHADTVIVVGTVTQICVEETAREAFHHGLKTVLVADAVSSFAPDLHAATLKNFAMKFGMVTESARLLELLGSRTA